MKVGDVFQGIVVVGFSGTQMQVRYPDDHPVEVERKARVAKEKAELAKRVAAGEAESYASYYDRPQTWYIPLPNKNGTPNNRDVIGRFLAGMKGVAGSFETNGTAIWSYGSHWILAEVADCVDGEVKVRWTDNMWRNPGAIYGSTTTTQHEWAVRSDPRMYGRVINEHEFPEGLIEEIAEAIGSVVFSGPNMENFTRVIARVVGYTRHDAIREAFVRAGRKIRMRIYHEVRNYTPLLAKSYTAESIKEVEQWHRTAPQFFTNLLGEYEKRYFKEYDEKMPPIPNRNLPAKPMLVRIPPKPVSKRTVAQHRAKGVLAWHFLPADRRLRFGDGRVVEVGCIHDVKTEEGYSGHIVLCSHGLHGSVRMADAYSYFNGDVLCRTLHYGIMDKGGDKLASQYRETLGMIDLRAEAAATLRDLILDRNSMAAEAEALRLLAMDEKQREVSTVGFIEATEGETVPF